MVLQTRFDATFLQTHAKLQDPRVTEGEAALQRFSVETTKGARHKPPLQVAYHNRANSTLWQQE